MSEIFEMDALLLGDEKISHLQGRMTIVGVQINEQLLNLFNGIELKLFEGEGRNDFDFGQQPVKIQGLLADYGDRVVTMLVARKGEIGNDELLILENDTMKGNYSGTAMELEPHLNGENIQALILAVYGSYIKEFAYSSQNDVIATLK